MDKRNTRGRQAALGALLAALLLGAVSAALCVQGKLPSGVPATVPLSDTVGGTQSGESGLLYRDLLSECVTCINGTEERVRNVTLAAQACSGFVLLPGDIFSFNQVVGERTAARGYCPAPSYMGGLTVDTVGGGICQVSSAIYCCAVYANLKTLTRHHHSLAVSYVPDGLDAAVSWDGLDLRFKNSSRFPVKIVAHVQDRTLTVRFYGTNPDGIYVETECSQVSFTDYATVYKADPSIPKGTTRVSVTPHTGRTVAVFRCVYAADGALISRALENTSSYAARNEVILYNPADAARLGLDPPTG